MSVTPDMLVEKDSMPPIGQGFPLAMSASSPSRMIGVASMPVRNAVAEVRFYVINVSDHRAEPSSARNA